MGARRQNSPAGDARRGQDRRALFAALVIVLAGAAAYASSFQGVFVFDDNDSIVANTAIRHLWPPWRFFGSLNRPVVNLTLAINYAIGGLRVGSYHAFNLAVHVLAALTLFGLVRRTLLLPPLRARFGGASTALALAVALLWELHPLQSEAVTYVIQRAESLAGLFCLLTLYCVLRGADSGRPWRWGACAFLACALGMATKQTVAAAPIVVFLYDRAFLAGSFREVLRKRWPIYVGLGATWLLLVPSAVTAVGRPGLSAGFQMSAWTPARYGLTELGVVLHYLRLAFWPSGLCVDYFWRAAQTAGDILPGAAVVGALLAATAAALALRPMWGFLGAWFFLALAPTSSIMPIADAAAERRMYLPLAAVIAFMVIGGYALAERWLRRRTAATGRISAAALVIVAALVIAATLGALTARRNLVYRSELSIWNDTVSKRPENPRGGAFLQGGLSSGLGGRAADAGDGRRAAGAVPSGADAGDAAGLKGIAGIALPRSRTGSRSHFSRGAQVFEQFAGGSVGHAGGRDDVEEESLTAVSADDLPGAFRGGADLDEFAGGADFVEHLRPLRCFGLAGAGNPLDAVQVRDRAERVEVR